MWSQTLAYSEHQIAADEAREERPEEAGRDIAAGDAREKVEPVVARKPPTKPTRRPGLIGDALADIAREDRVS
jgi:hypothetical protein